ncbi:MAG: helix-turn-helix transcriptional regulator [Ruminococcaceae bacterium]|nr:helix-turn-helix transcriptional regulator [Oscillospiraceae bacterium]
MDNLTKIVRTEIARQYKSVRQFAFAVNIPLSTINSALHNGIGGSSFDTVVQICRALGIKALSDDASFYLTEETQRLFNQYSQLDDYGRHTIKAVMQVEYDRCTELSAPSNDAYGMPSVNVSADADGLR